MHSISKNRHIGCGHCDIFQKRVPNEVDIAGVGAEFAADQMSSSMTNLKPQKIYFIKKGAVKLLMKQFSY